MRLSLLNLHFVLAISMASVACKRDAPVGQDNQARAAAPEPDPVDAYPPGRWRLVDPSELDHVVLWVSQILIRHEGVNPDPAFAMADWHSPSPGGQRSKAEALRLARELRGQAAKAPESFAELAQQHSEDVATRERGGSLGGIPASQFPMWPNVLDALAATPVGQVSEVIETHYGYHILKRRAPPPEDTVTGAHIVIGHSQAGWLQILGRSDDRAVRSRDEALALANELYIKAKEKPEEFAQLVERYSEHRDAAHGGDMGTWSTREPTFYPREVELLGTLAVGEVAPPVDSHVGFQIVQRTPNRGRERFAMEEIRVFFEPARPAPGPLSQVWALNTANQAALELRADPSRFDAFRQEHCCSYAEEWPDGRGSPALTDMLQRLDIGQIAKEPVRSELSYVVAKRVEPSTRPSPTTRFDLPEPPAPDILALVRSRDATFLRDELRQVADEVQQRLVLPEPAAKRVAELHDGGDRFKGLDTPEARVEAFNSLMADVKAVLGPDVYPRYSAVLDAHFERILLASG